MTKILKKQEELKNNIIISGLPTQNKETDELKEVLINIGKELQVTIKKEDIDCIRIGKEGKEKLKVIFKADKQKKRYNEKQKRKKIE